MVHCNVVTRALRRNESFITSRDASLSGDEMMEKPAVN
jgi:hypothetical protein